MNDSLEELRRLEEQAEAFVSRQPLPKPPPALSARELAARVESSYRRGWVTPHGQFIHAGSNADTITLGPFTVSGHAAAIMTWLPQNDPVLHRQLEDLLFHQLDHPASTERRIKRFMFRQGFVRVENRHESLELECETTAPQLALAQMAAQLLGLEANLVSHKPEARQT